MLWDREQPRSMLLIRASLGRNPLRGVRAWGKWGGLSRGGIKDYDECAEYLRRFAERSCRKELTQKT